MTDFSANCGSEWPAMCDVLSPNFNYTHMMYGYDYEHEATSDLRQDSTEIT